MCINAYASHRTCPTKAARIYLGHRILGRQGTDGELRHQAELTLAKITEPGHSKAESPTLVCYPEVLAFSWRGRDGERGGRCLKLTAPGFHSTAMTLGDRSTHSYLLSTYYVPAPV